MGNEKCNILTAYASKMNEVKPRNLQDVLPGYFASIMKEKSNNYIDLRKALFEMPEDIIPTHQETGAAEVRLTSCEETNFIRENRRLEVENFRIIKESV